MAATSIVLSLIDLPLYATQPWRNAPLLILGYALLPGIFALAARPPVLSRPAARAPGAAAPSARG
jgi:hypothetical protein